MATRLVIDHIVISVSDLTKSIKFYSAFLGKAKLGKEDAHFMLGATKLFLTSPYKQSAKKFDKHNIGLNHIAFQVDSLPRLKAYKQLLDKAGIAHSSIQIDNYSLKEFIHFDDPDGIRLELYLRKPH
ncbi:MAG: VOC family protein [Candidatus Doudnabacteria bacterium]|jgi:catechol-2,3-dioxygenase|nr:VOC family protein [Candidatus Doudnabacteria bacterium]